MEEEVKQDTSETETQEKRNTEECEETAEASAENTETPEDGEASEEKDKKGFFSGRKKEKKEDAVKAQINELQDKVLPVVDNFERGLATVPEDEKDAPFVDGMNKVYRQLLTELENLGVKPIEAVGKEFDPNFHNAVMQVENDELEPGTVAQELLKGYMYRDTVVRHSMVAVVQE